MILGVILLTIGAALMLLGVFMLWEWLGGASKFSENSQRDRPTRQPDLVLMGLWFLSLVVASLLGGAILIVFGLARVR